MFSGGLERDHWHEIGQELTSHWDICFFDLLVQLRQPQPVWREVRLRNCQNIYDQDFLRK